MRQIHGWKIERVGGLRGDQCAHTVPHIDRRGRVQQNNKTRRYPAAG